MSAPQLSRDRIAKSRRPPRAPAVCVNCGDEIPYSGAGRPRKFCDTCVEQSAVPDYVKSRQQARQLKESPKRKVREAKRAVARSTGGRGLVQPEKALGRRIIAWPGTVNGVPWTVTHFRRWCERLVFEDGEHHPPEEWQIEFVTDLFRGYEEVWLVVPEGNSKTTLISVIGLYHLDNTREPWVPVGASSRDQAEILFGQAQGFVLRSLCEHGKRNQECCGVPGLKYDRNLNPRGPFQLAGHRQIKHMFNMGRGMKVYAADHETADGVIPTLSFVDEGHRLKDLAQYRTWHGKGEKRGGQVVMISTAGEPGGDFEKTREEFRQNATDKVRVEPCFLRAATETTVIHEYAVPKPSMARDIDVVKAANPLSKISKASLARKLNSPSLNYGESWLRLTCNIPARSEKAAVSELDWDRAYTDDRIPEGQPVIVGADFAWLLDCTAIVPCWVKSSTNRLIDRSIILDPPRDGSMLDPDEVKGAFMRIHRRNPIIAVIGDKSRAEDTMLWLETGDDGPHCIVVDRTQGNADAIQDYEMFMEALRGGAPEDEEGPPRVPWLRHTGNTVLRTHVMNAIARKLPSDHYRFDRATPSRAAALQDHRVIDGLTAMAFVNTVAAIGWMPTAVPLVAYAKDPTDKKDSDGPVPSRKPAVAGMCSCGHKADAHVDGDGPCNVTLYDANTGVHSACGCSGFSGSIAA